MNCTYVIISHTKSLLLYPDLLFVGLFLILHFDNFETLVHIIALLCYKRYYGLFTGAFNWCNAAISKFKQMLVLNLHSIFISQR